METISFSHSGNAGDIIYALPSIKMICEKQKKQAVIYIRLNQPSGFTDAQHPLGGVMMNQTMYDLLKPLLIWQSYVLDVLYYDEESIPTIDYDLDRFRVDYLNLSSGNIAQWINNSYPELRPNLYEPSIKVSDNIKSKDYIIVNRSSRYQNLFFDYSQLSKYENVYFVGVESEFKVLKLHNANIIHLQVPNFLKLAEYIANCKLFIGNQSMAFSIAEQLKVPRILEQYAHAPNVIPQGGEYFVCHTSNQFNNAISLCLNGENYDTSKAKNTREAEASHGC
jgi:hypothetical protein